MPKVAILGTGNIGTDLLVKLRRRGRVEVALFAGIDPASPGIARARELGVAVSTSGVEAVLERDDVRVVFDATSARAHREHAPKLQTAGKVAVDLTPAAIGPPVVPVVNLTEHLDATNVNLTTCGGQATTPIVHALSRVTPLLYAETVSTIASASAGPGTRQNIDEFTTTTARAIERIGGAAQGKAIIILNPARPPILMGNTIFAIPEDPDAPEAAALTASVERMVGDIQEYVPGYRVKVPLIIDRQTTRWGERVVLTIAIEVRGAGDFLPPYSGNLDIMTAAACKVGEELALRSEPALVH